MINYIVVFHTTSASLQLFKILKSKNYNISMIATPCTISAGCARAIEFQQEDLDKIVQEIRENEVVIRAIYKRVINKKKLHYVRINI